MRGEGVAGVRFEPPVLHRTCVARPRLLEPLRDRLSRRVTQVIAPAGMGKTTLLAQLLEASRTSASHIDVWLTCGPDDAALSSFAGGLHRALGVAPCPAVGELIEPVVEGLVNTMWHRSPAHVTLLLDDVHEIPDGSPGALLLTRLIAALPRNGHLVLAGRRPAPIAVSRLEVQGDAMRLGESDLLFTSDERERLAAARGVSAERLARCANWPALAELVAAADPEVEVAYLWEEVLDRLPPQSRRDLALLVHVGPFNEQLAGAALDREVNIAELTADLPLVTVTPAGGWRIHELWRPHLADAVSPIEIAQARRRVGLALAEMGEAAAATRQLVQAEAWDDLTGVIIDGLSAAKPAVAGDLVSTWKELLPQNLAVGPLGLLLGAVASAPHHQRTAIGDLWAAAEAFRQIGDTDGELACITQLGQRAWWAGDATLLADVTRRVFEMEGEGSDKAVPLACLSRAVIADLGADSHRVLDELGRIPIGSLRGSWKSLVEWLRSMALHHLGRPAEALDAASLAREGADPLLAPIIESTRLQALWYLGDIQPACDELPRLADWAHEAGLRDNGSLLAAGAAMALAAVGDTADAIRYLDLARRSTTTPLAPLVDAYLTVAGAATAIAQGDEPAATRLLVEYAGRCPTLDAGVAASVQRRSLTLWYLLVPTTRTLWETADLGPCFARARELARTLVAVRDDASNAHLPALGEPRMVRALMPATWAIELALAYIAARRQDGWDLLEAMWPEAQPEVRRRVASRSEPLQKAARSVLTRLPVPPPARLGLSLLGPSIELRRDGALVDAPEWRRERVRSLVAYLALNRPANRERLALALWPDMDTDAQSRNLRVTLSHLLRVLEPKRSERDASFMVRSHGSSLILHDNEWLDVDLWHFDRLWEQATSADSGHANPHAVLDAMREAIRLWRGDPGELGLNDWALMAVEERRLRLVSMAARAGELLLAQDRLDEARQMAETALDVDPWFDRAHLLAIEAHEAAGQRRAAQLARNRYDRAKHDLEPHKS